MEEVKALLQSLHEHENAELTENLLLEKLNTLKEKILQSSGLPQLLVFCHAVVEIVVYLEGRPRIHQGQSLVTLLEIAIMYTYRCFNRLSDDLDKEKDNMTSSTDWRFLRSALVRVLQYVYVHSTDSGHAGVIVVSRLVVLLSCCWLRYDRSTNMEKITAFLSAVVEFCDQHPDAYHLAKQPLFLLGMVHLVEKQEKEQALTYFQLAARLTNSSSDEIAQREAENAGVFHYWYAMVLLKNGYMSDAIEQLKNCLRANYEPVASLTLSALIHLQERQDVQDAAAELERALEVDFSQSISIFNYALLLGRMGNYEAQLQMLHYFQEAVSSNSAEKDLAMSALTQKRKRDGSRTEMDVMDRSALFADVKMSDLFPSKTAQVSTKMMNYQLANAALENGEWLEAKQYFEAYLDQEVESASSPKHSILDAALDYVYVLLQCDCPSLSLTKCDDFLAKYGDELKNNSRIFLLHLYKADALLSLERVDDCHDYLKNIGNINATSTGTSSPCETAIMDDIALCHSQLLNNLAVAIACRDDIDAAIATLRQGLQQYPKALNMKFNLVLLLWRKAQKEAACTIWIETRGWNLQMDPNELGNDDKLLDIVASTEDAAVMASADTDVAISRHVYDEDRLGGVSKQQLLYLDALVLNHWGKIRNEQVVKNSLNYVSYLENLAAAKEN